MIDLSANENPYNQALLDVNKGIDNINRYLSTSELDELLLKISEYCNIPKSNILLGAGTNMLIEKILIKYYSEKSLVVLNPNYYSAQSLAKNLKMKTIRLQITPPNFRISWDKINISDSIIIIDYPNNPTGQLLIDEKQLLNLLSKNNIVIIDEAGFEYCEESFVNLIPNYKNLVITRTFDKAFGLAGLKTSYLLASNNIIETLDKEILINRSSLSSSLYALKNKSYMQSSVKETIKEKELLTKRLEDLNIQVFKSQANYILVYTEIPDFALQLLKRNIKIEDLSSTWLNNYYRISIGNHNENNQLLHEISFILNS